MCLGPLVFIFKNTVHQQNESICVSRLQKMKLVYEHMQTGAPLYQVSITAVKWLVPLCCKSKLAVGIHIGDIGKVLNLRVPQLLNIVEHVRSQNVVG
jgi:hypothetical protein